MDLEASTSNPQRKKSLALRIQRSFPSLRFLTPPTPNPLERSRFSPDSPTFPSPPSTSKKTFFSRRTDRDSNNTESTRSPQSVARSKELPPADAWINPFHLPAPGSDDTAHFSRPAAPSRVKTAFARFLRRPSSGLPISNPLETYENRPNPYAAPWKPLNIEKRSQALNELSEKERAAKSRKRRILLLSGGGIIVVVIVAIVLVLIFRLRNNNNKAQPQPAAGQLSAEQTRCLNDFRTTAPTQPKEYPASECLPLLQSIPATFIQQNPGEADAINAAISFSILRSLYDASSGGAQAAFDAGGWFADTRLCTWEGVKCGGDTRVNSLTFAEPALPDTIPAEITGIKGLAALTITGDSQRPSGKLPPLPASLLIVSLTNTGLEGPLEDSHFVEGSRIVDVRLVNNANLGATLPASLLSLPLQTLIVTGQNLEGPLDDIASSSTLASSLSFLDLSNNAIATDVPSFGAFTRLEHLNLSTNRFGFLPVTTTFPSSLRFLSFAGNDRMAGEIPPALCNGSIALDQCSFQNTLFSEFGDANCGACLF